MRNEPQIRGNLHHLAGIDRTRRNKSAYCRGLATCPGSALCIHRQGGLQLLPVLVPQGLTAVDADAGAETKEPVARSEEHHV